MLKLLDCDIVVRRPHEVVATGYSGLSFFLVLTFDEWLMILFFIILFLFLWLMILTEHLLRPLLIDDDIYGSWKTIISIFHHGHYKAIMPQLFRNYINCVKPYSESINKLN